VLCGAKGYVVKSNAPRDLLAAVEAVSQHRNFMARSPEGLRPVKQGTTE